jgi:hypothetical protein
MNELDATPIDLGTALSLEPVKFLIRCHSIGSRGIQFYIESRGQSAWICNTGAADALNTDGQFEYEPLPSSRTDEFIARTRFVTPEAALANFEKHLPNLAEGFLGKRKEMI